MVDVDDLKIAMRAAIDPAGLMQRVADQTLELVDGANGVLIGLADRQGVSYVWGAGVAEKSVGTRVSMDSSLSGFAIRMRRSRGRMTVRRIVMSIRQLLDGSPPPRPCASR